ncbi:MAG: hypothetical protein HRT89_03300 [Lentisphaeria bacterium]|nr:hypothetical protein [Lentisphaeria bacterium]NQZ67077.1 hypothetical protein [Lentisphaeria bacterium]
MTDEIHAQFKRKLNTHLVFMSDRSKSGYELEYEARKFAAYMDDYVSYKQENYERVMAGYDA